jgi:hypothetical protein
MDWIRRPQDREQEKTKENFETGTGNDIYNPQRQQEEKFL